MGPRESVCKVVVPAVVHLTTRLHLEEGGLNMYHHEPRVILPAVLVLLIAASLCLSATASDASGAVQAQPEPTPDASPSAPPAYLPLVLQPVPTPTPVYPGFMWKSMPEVVQIFEDAGLSVHIENAAFVSENERVYDMRTIRTYAGRSFTVETSHDATSLETVWFDHYTWPSIFCFREFPLERCRLHAAKLENITLGVLLDGGPWVFDYLDALEPVCKADPDCDWGALDRYPDP